ncbi:MAG TPA: ABC transporter permease [Clostridia bacterium]|nr:ABC transporter permease [Clostridia bacterium]
MTFFELSTKMLFANFRRYRLYFLCNVFSIVLFYCMASLFTNQSFMNGNVVDSSISSNIYAPSLFTGIFVALFIPYSYHAFMKNRKQEYGILMTLGMSETEVLANMLLENCVTAGLSLISGLILGTFVSFLFYFIIQQIIGLAGLRWYFNADSYKWTVILYGVTMLLTLVTGILGFLKTQLTDLMKEKFRAEKKGKSLPGLFAAGAVLVIVSVVIGYGHDPSNILLASMALMFAGLWLTINHAESAEQFIFKRNPDYRRRHILGISFVRQHDASRKMVGILAAWLIGFSVFFAGFCAISYPSFTENAIHYSPYDLVYSRIFGKNQAADSEIKNLLSQNGVSVKALKQVDYLRSGAFNLLSVSEADKNLNCNYQIPKGRFLTVFQYDLNDGYQHDPVAAQTIPFHCGHEELKLQSAGSSVRILFNQNPTFADYTLILNDADYGKIASESHDFWRGTMKLYSFHDWKNSEKGVNAVRNYLLEKNQGGINPSRNIIRQPPELKPTQLRNSPRNFLFF